MWTGAELDVYFGSNGEMWPRGKRPAWVGRPVRQGQPADMWSSSNKPAAQQLKQPVGEKVYPELKEHFQALGLDENTSHDAIRKHYRRLAREYHPDKHLDDGQKATARFQAIQAAFEAVSQRLRL